MIYLVIGIIVICILFCKKKEKKVDDIKTDMEEFTKSNIFDFIVSSNDPKISLKFSDNDEK